MPVWTGTSMTCGNSIQVIYFLFMSDWENLCFVHSHFVFNLPVLRTFSSVEEMQYWQC